MHARTGSQYIAGLKDRREVWVAGERVEDVTSHPAFARPIGTIAQLYDMQHDPARADTLAGKCEATGERVPIWYLPPYSRDDLSRRRAAVKLWADATCGLMGRSPDFLSIAITAFASARGFFAEVSPRFADNLVRYHDHCRGNDLFLAHATINPQVDRSRASSEQDDPFVHLRIVEETSDGLVLRGAKMIGTLVPIADELLVFPLPRYAPGDEPYTAAFAIPVSTPGLRLVCREPFGPAGRDLFDHPLARFDEMDATCIFDDVLVPWERVFFYGDVARANALYDATTARHHTGHQGVTRGLAKAELLVAIAIELAESAKTTAFLHVQEMLGELIGMLELARGAVLLSEENATTSPWGTICPAIAPIQALRYHFPRMCWRMIEVIQLLGGGSLLSTPTSADLAAAVGDDVRRFFRGADGRQADDRIRLLKLAWDATGDAFGQRQQQYERYHSGDPVRLAALQYLAYDTSQLRRILRSALGAVPATGQARA